MMRQWNQQEPEAVRYQEIQVGYNVPGQVAGILETNITGRIICQKAHKLCITLHKFSNLLTLTVQLTTADPRLSASLNIDNFLLC